MEKRVEKRSQGSHQDIVMPQYDKPVWEQGEVNCRDCHYNDQDIDTFPCAKCHIRH